MEFQTKAIEWTAALGLFYVHTINNILFNLVYSRLFNGDDYYTNGDCDWIEFIHLLLCTM